MRPFKLKEALAGKPMITRSGNNVLDIYYTEVECKYPFAALIQFDDEAQWQTNLIDGSYGDNDESPLDLLMADEEPEQECEAGENEPQLVGINRSLEELEKSVEELKIKSAHKSNHLLNRIEDLEDLEDEMQRQRKQINILTSIVEKLEGKQIQEKEPHKCSVCDGTGKFLTDVGHKLIIAGRYKMDEFGRRYIDCEICHSKGILWG